MRAPWALTAGVVIAAIVAAGLAGVVVGIRAGERASAPDVEQLVIADPSFLAGTAPDALRSAGGFTGFGGLPALPGDVLRAGTVVEADGGLLVVAAEGSTTAIQYSATARLFRFGPLARALTAGDLVVVRLEDGEPTGVLLVPPDIEEGLGLAAGE